MPEPIETRVSLIEEKHKNLLERYTGVCEKLATLEKAQNKQDLTNEKILGAVNLINTKMDTKKENNTLWLPVLAMIAFEILVQIIVPMLTIV